MIRLRTLPPLVGLAAAIGALAAPIGVEAQQRNRPPRAVAVENARAIALVELEISRQDARKRTISVGKLGKPLGSGETTELSLRNVSGCVYTVTWSFETSTESDVAEVDLCKDRTIRVTD